MENQPVQPNTNNSINEDVTVFLNQPDVQSLLVTAEKERENILLKTFTFYVSGAAIILILQYVFGTPQLWELNLRILMFGLFGAVFYFIGSIKKIDPRNTVIPLLAKKIDPNLTYSFTLGDDFMPVWINDPKLVAPHGSIDGIGDHITYTFQEGAGGKVFLDAYEITASIGSGKSRQVVTQAFITEITFTSPRLSVTPDVFLKEEHSGDILEKSISDIFGAPKDKIVLESNEFNRQFNVFCDDQIVARQVLTPNMMATLEKFCNSFSGKRTYNFLFRENKLYVIYNMLASSDASTFMAMNSLSNYTKNTQQFENFYREFLGFKKLIQDLNLTYYEL